jgi:hypothetical protein
MNVRVRAEVQVPPPCPGPLTRLSRHWHWARTQGVARLIEEDGLDFTDRARSALRKRRWRQAHGVEPGTAVPVFLVGVQRSGTNMIVRGLEAAPEFEVHNENDRRAFDRFQLRPLPDIRRIVEASGHRFVLFKPLCDSHRVDELLDQLGTVRPGRAIWAYRSVDGRVASALAKFGDVNLRVLRAVAAGNANGRWQVQRMSEETLAFLAGFNYGAMSPASAAALFWYVRNVLVFELGLDQRPDVAVVSYDALLADPEEEMASLCRFLGFGWRPSLTAHIERRSAPGPGRLEIDRRVRERCEALAERLDAVRTTRR